MGRKNLGLKFDTGLIVGRWDLPDPTAEPRGFNAMAADIGWHIALEIARGAKSVEFIDMDDDGKGQK